jgi:hypothetical protein
VKEIDIEVEPTQTWKYNINITKRWINPSKEYPPFCKYQQRFRRYCGYSTTNDGA